MGYPIWQRCHQPRTANFLLWLHKFLEPVSARQVPIANQPHRLLLTQDALNRYSLGYELGLKIALAPFLEEGRLVRKT